MFLIVERVQIDRTHAGDHRIENVLQCVMLRALMRDKRGWTVTPAQPPGPSPSHPSRNNARTTSPGLPVNPIGPHQPTHRALPNLHRHPLAPEYIKLPGQRDRSLVLSCHRCSMFYTHPGHHERHSASLPARSLCSLTVTKSRIHGSSGQKKKNLPKYNAGYQSK